jgi:hypothetical protein
MDGNITMETTIGKKFDFRKRETLVLVLLSLTRSLCVSLSRVGIISVEKEKKKY